MEDTLKLIAERVQELREICNYTPEQAARAVDMAPEEYIAYESAEKEFPISAIIRLAALFHVEVGALLTGGEPKLHVYNLTRKGQGRGVSRRRQYQYQSLAYNFTGKIIEPFHVTTQPETDGKPIVFNEHSGQEFDYVLQGVLRLVINQEELILHPGDCVYFDSSFPHGMQAVGDKPAEFLAIVIPKE